MANGSSSQGSACDGDEDDDKSANPTIFEEWSCSDCICTESCSYSGSNPARTVGASIDPPTVLLRVQEDGGKETKVEGSCNSLRDVSSSILINQQELHDTIMAQKQ